MRSLIQPVIEVMAEIGFATGDGQVLPEQAGTQLFARLKTRYPNYERATDVQLQVEMRDDIEAIEARCERVSHRFLYRSNPPAVTVQVSPQAVQIQFSGPYIGWERIQDVIEREWTTAAQALGLRLGEFLMLRFVVHLPLLPGRQTLGYWLKPNVYVPEAIRHTDQQYQSRVELMNPATDIHTAVGVAPILAPVLEAVEIKPIGLEVAIRQDLAHRVVRKHFAPRMQTLFVHIRSVFQAMLSDHAQRHLQMDLSQI